MPPGATGIGVVRLTPEIYVGAQPNLADLRIVRNGEEAPYVIETLTGAVENTEISPAVLNQSVVPGRGLQVTLDLGGHVKHNRLRISTGEANFRQKVRIETSNDGRSWAIARSDGYIFDFSQGDRHVAVLSVEYPDSTMRYVRSTIFGWMKTDAVSRVWSAYYRERPAVREVMDALTPERSEDRNAKSTVLTMKLSQPGLPYDRIRIESGSARFYRTAELETSIDGKTWRFLERGTIYQISSDSSLTFTFAERHDRYLRLLIRNVDDQPISENHVFLEAPVRQLKFPLPAVGGRTILFAGNPSAKAPSYDFATVIAREAPQPEVRATLLAPRENAGYRPAAPPVKPWSERYPQLLYATLAIAILVTGYATIRLLIKVKKVSG